MNFATLKDGLYLAKCREKTVISAGLNGHLSIWPEATMRIIGNEAVFFRDGKRVWSCNMLYAANQFDVLAIDEP